MDIEVEDAALWLWALRNKVCVQYSTHRCSKCQDYCNEHVLEFGRGVCPVCARN